MESVVLKLILSVSVFLWFIVCLALYTWTREAAWLAGSTVSSCLFLLGATAAASILVPGTHYLVPLGGGVFLFALIHLRCACKQSRLSTAAINHHPRTHPDPGNVMQDPASDYFI